MLKLLGAVIVLAAGTLIGFFQSAQLTRRPKQIRQLIHSLQRLETEIVYGFTPLPEALQLMAGQTPAPLSSIFRDIAAGLSSRQGWTTTECWSRAIAEGWGRTSMKKSEQDVLLRLGHTLGISDREDQIKHLRLAVSQLQDEEAAAKDEERRYEKMWKSLGLLTGALVVVLMY